MVFDVALSPAHSLALSITLSITLGIYLGLAFATICISLPGPSGNGSSVK